MALTGYSFPPTGDGETAATVTEKALLDEVVVLRGKLSSLLDNHVENDDIERDDKILNTER